jgi:hypothetical protein
MLINLTTSHRGIIPLFHYKDLILIDSTHNHVTLNSIIDSQDSIELCNLRWICMEIDEGIITLGKIVDLKSKLALAPVLDAVDYSAVGGKSDVNTLHYASAVFLSGSWVNKKQQFIGLHIVTSSGLMASGSEGAPEAGKFDQASYHINA